MNNTVLVTGSDGFIGSRVVSTMSHSHIVKAGVRSSISARKLEARFEIGEITGETQWHDKLADVSTVIHLAAVAHNNSNDPNYINEVNVKGTINLAQQAVEIGVKRFVFISSIGVLGNRTLMPFNEKSSTAPHSSYAESKLKAEIALLKIARESELEVVIIRPVLVYGPGAPGNFAKLVNLVHKLPMLPFALCKNKRSFISVDNLVDFISTCVDHPMAKNEVFCISDGNDVSIREFTDGIAKGLSKNLIQLPIPVSIFKLLGKITGKSEPIEQLIGDLQVDSRKAKKLLNWSPPLTMAETFSKLTINN
jgi:nucleoside-diphosphate-sugar epimerase